MRPGDKCCSGTSGCVGKCTTLQPWCPTLRMPTSLCILIAINILPSTVQEVKAVKDAVKKLGKKRKVGPVCMLTFAALLGALCHLDDPTAVSRSWQPCTAIIVLADDPRICHDLRPQNPPTH